MLSYPSYETALFLAYLSIVPSMEAFTLSVEASFFEKYLQFYGDIQRHVPLARIHANQQELIQSFLDGGRNFLVVQGSVSIGMILVAPQLFEWLGIGFGQLAIFRFGLPGAFFHGGVPFLWRRTLCSRCSRCAEAFRITVPDTRFPRWSPSVAGS